MDLKDLDIKIKYDSDHDDMIAKFYNPVLSKSNKYYRMSGFFTSTVLSAVARGLEDFIKNDGKMYLICSALLSKEDLNLITEYNKNPEEILEKYLIKEIDTNQIEDEFTKNHLKALAWMLANNRLKIKIAIVDEKAGMFHQKIGIVEDKQGNKVSFSGSNNETANGLKYNVEEFKVFKSWDATNEYIEEDLKLFNKYWNDLSKRTKVIALPKAVEEKILEIAPKSIEEINLPKEDKNKSKARIEYKQEKKEEEIKLRDYQKEAIDAWWNNDKRGIFEMATGTGKTYTALACFKKLFDEDDNLITVIACPQQHLIDQWKKDVKKFYDGKILVASSQNYKWKKEIKSLINNFYLKIEKNLVIITTHKTLASNSFIENIRKFKNKMLLIVDEVHGIGSEKQLDALHEKYNYRLGLSATPERWFDDEGTQAIMDYFGEVVFQFDISDALNTINPDTGDYYLTPYVYTPIICNLNSDESEEYSKLSVKIANFLNKVNKTKKEVEELKQLIFRRKRIIDNAEDKLRKLEELLDKNLDIKDLIIFASPEQLGDVQKLLNEKNIIQHKFTHVEKIKKEDKYGGLTEREYLIENFENGSYKAIVAIKCLDEGVDIPSAKNAIIMSSTTNPREHVQRRGRILRRHPGKNEANIYDMLVFPQDGSNQSKNIIKKESKRYREFALNSKNSIDSLDILKLYSEEI
ncbi:MAG: DEAD/DEAH box helicase family protein [Methanobrevibacter sp.]|jgi:superfamily II DNA or RNA helicase|nr:DEAD/DEAH box helicase family protein [Candidatus Methanoflexus mossambicus]